MDRAFFRGWHDDQSASPSRRGMARHRSGSNPAVCDVGLRGRWPVKLIIVKQEAHHRGYRIEGVKQGEGLLLHVTPTRPDLPILEYSRFRTLRSTWVKAVRVVVGYIDEALIDTAREGEKEVAS